MVQIVDSDGSPVTISDDSINVISGPYPYDRGTKSYIRGGFGPGALESNEDAAQIVARLQAKEKLEQLTRPNATPVWIKPSAISELRYPLDTEIPSPPNIVRSVIIVGGFHQALQEDLATVQKIMPKGDLRSVLTAAVAARKSAKLTKEIFTPPKQRIKTEPARRKTPKSKKTRPRR